MHLFLTSSPTGPLDNSYFVDGIDGSNGFKQHLQALFFDGMRGLMFAAYPEDYVRNDEMVDYFAGAFSSLGKRFSTFDLCDYRYPFSKEEIESYDLIVLAGGHTPRQNAFFKEIGLREKLADYQGIVLGISAGSMNMADTVYFQPEEPGESAASFVRSGQGLGLCDISVVPHFQMIRHFNLDGWSLVYDLIRSDSYGRELLALNDGSYVYVDEQGRTIVNGAAWLLKDGEFKEFCKDGLWRCLNR